MFCLSADSLTAIYNHDANDETLGNFTVTCTTNLYIHLYLSFAVGWPAKNEINGMSQSGLYAG